MDFDDQATLMAVLRRQVANGGQRLAFGELNATGAIARTLTFDELARCAASNATQLRQYSRPGDRVAIACPYGLDYVVALWSCFNAGVVAVPLPAPKASRQRERVVSALEKLDVRTCLVERGADGAKVARMREGLQVVHVASDPSIATTASFDWPDSQAADVAVLQCTSGSTQAGRAVALTHANLLANERMIKESFGVTARDRVLSWLPFYHDMGLVGAVLQSVYSGIPCYLLDPGLFAARPESWLEAISTLGITISGGPNFGYELCARALESNSIGDVDLSAWRVAFVGAEVVRSATLERFLTLLEGRGLQRQAITPCYGLAEASLLVSTNRSGPRYMPLSTVALARGELKAPAHREEPARTIVSSGIAATGTDLRIVNPLTCEPCALGSIGEVWVRSPSCGRGYWNDPEGTARTFGVKVRGEDDQPGYLRTGDLGALLGDELLITGRFKDLVIVNGVNHHAEDIEDTVLASHHAVADERGAVFAVDVADEEQLIVLQEIRTTPDVDYAGVLDAITAAVIARNEVRPAVVGLIRAGHLPRTSSGKISRRECRDRYTAATLKFVARRDRPAEYPVEILEAESTGSPMQQDRAARLRQVIADAVGVRESALPLDVSLVALGLDSLALSRLRNAVRWTCHLDVPFEWLTSERTVAQLLEDVGTRRIERDRPVTQDDSPSANSVETLSEQQKAIVALLRYGGRFTNAYWLARAVRVKGELSMVRLEEAVSALVQRHRLLRSRADRLRDGLLLIAPDTAGFVTHERVDGLYGAALGSVVTALARSHDWSRQDERLFRLHVLEVGTADHIVVLGVHHLISDLALVELWLRDLVALYMRAEPASPPGLSGHGESLDYRTYVRWQRDMLDGRSGADSVSYWQSNLSGPLPAITWNDGQRSASVIRDEPVRFALTKQATQCLQQLAQDLGVTLFASVVAATGLVLMRLSESRDVTVGALFNARTNSAWEHIVGPVANALPIRMRDADGTIEQLIRSAAAALAGALQHQDLPVSKIIEAVAPRDRRGRNPLFQVVLNYYRSSACDTAFFAGLALDETDALAATRVGDLAITPYSIGGRETHSEMAVTFTLSDGVLKGRVDYGGAASAGNATSVARLLNNALNELPELRHRQVESLLPVHAEAEEGWDLHFAGAPAGGWLEEILGWWLDALGVPHTITTWAADLDPNVWMGPALRTSNRAVILVNAETTDLHVLLAAYSPLENAGRTQSHCFAMTFGAAAATSMRVVRDQRHKATWLDLADLVGRQFGAAAVPRLSAGADQPLSSEMREATAYTLARSIFPRLGHTYKVAVFDCDHTLWSGLCGEEGAEGVIFEECHLALHNWALGLRARGVVLALCSRNDIADVRATFERSAVLRMSDFAAVRVNWQPKSANMESMAAELGLPLSAFVLFDDDAAQCLEVEEGCPGIVCVQVPPPSVDWAAFFRHLWIFDGDEATSEDAARSQMYQDHGLRETERLATLTPQEFAARLDLVVTIQPMLDADLSRVAQLVTRTNQFNLTLNRTSASGLATALQSEDYECWVTRASDRFGDYGLVGATIGQVNGRRLDVIEFALSCRALGRGVETRMLESLRDVGRSRGCSEIVVAHTPTKRNATARQFLSETAVTPYEQRGETAIYRLAVDGAMAAPEPARSDDHAAGREELLADGTITASLTTRARRAREFLIEVALSCHDGSDIERFRRSRKQRRPDAIAEYEPPRTKLEAALCQMWVGYLGVAEVGVFDNFFDLGGHSLLATELIARIEGELPDGTALLPTFFESPTVAAVAAEVTRVAGQRALSDQFADALTDAGARANA